MKKEQIPLPTVGEILKEEFLEPMDISAYRLAKDIKVPYSRIQGILNGTRRVTADTSLRLARYFGMSDSFFMGLQNDIDIRTEKQNLKEELKTIKPRDVAIA